MSKAEVFFGVLIGGYFLWSYWSRKRGAKVIKTLGDDLQKGSQYFEADPLDYPHLDSEWYGRVEHELSLIGYRLMGNLGIEGTNSYVRVCASADGHESVGFFHMKQRGFAGLILKFLGTGELRVIEASTEFTDGTSETVTTAPHNMLMGIPESMKRAHLPADSTARGVAMAHSKSVVARRIANPDLKPVVIKNFEDVLASQAREDARKRGHYAEHGVMTREDLERIGGPELRGVANKTYDEIEKLKAKEERGARKTPR